MLVTSSGDKVATTLWHGCCYLVTRLPLPCHLVVKDLLLKLLPGGDNHVTTLLQRSALHVTWMKSTWNVVLHWNVRQCTWIMGVHWDRGEWRKITSWCTWCMHIKT